MGINVSVRIREDESFAKQLKHFESLVNKEGIFHALKIGRGYIKPSQRRRQSKKSKRNK